MASEKKKRGRCRVCRRPYQLTAAGLVRSHWARAETGEAAPGLVDCSGAGKEPEEATDGQ